MRKIKYIVIHCTAGFSLIPAIESFWYRSKANGGLGWKSPGYHIIIYENGETWYLGKDGKYSKDPSKLDLSKVTNGVLGFNQESVHISYVGGVDKKNVSKSVDTRTPEQKDSIIKAIGMVQNLIMKAGQDYSYVKIQGHRDFSPDKNGNDVIDSWERIKECPSFDAIPEYEYLIPKSVSKTMYTISDLNVREGPGTEWRTITSAIPKGDSVTVIDTDKDWSKVLVNKTGINGWVSSKYLR